MLSRVVKRVCALMCMATAAACGGVAPEEANQAEREVTPSAICGYLNQPCCANNVCYSGPSGPLMTLMIEQKEADRPPPAPNLTGNVTIAGEEPTTIAYEGNEGSLWTISGSTRRVLSTSVPGPSTAILAFGLVYVDETEYLWRVNFVAHIEDSSALSDFLAEMPSGTALQTSPPTALPEEWDDYMEDPFAF